MLSPFFRSVRHERILGWIRSLLLRSKYSRIKLFSSNKRMTNLFLWPLLITLRAKLISIIKSNWRRSKLCTSRYNWFLNGLSTCDENTKCNNQTKIGFAHEFLKNILYVISDRMTMMNQLFNLIA